MRISANSGQLYSKRCTGATGWSSLLTELLVMILMNLDLADHLRFSCVCRSWRSIATTTDKMNKPLSLVRTNDPRLLISRLLRPRLLPFSSTKFIGSFEDWLVVQLYPQSLFLFNPALGGATIPLPPLPGFNCAHKALLSASPSSGKCIIVIRERRHWLASLRLEDTTAGWNFFYQPSDYKTPRVSDVVFFNDRLYTIDTEGDMKVFDSGLNSNPTSTGFPRFGGDGEDDRVGNLVSVFDKLLVIKTTLVSPYYKVFVLNPENSSSIPLKSIGDNNILFFSPICALALLAKDHKDLQPNRLYGNYPCPGGAKLVSYNLEKKTLTRERASNTYPIFFTMFKHMQT